MYTHIYNNKTLKSTLLSKNSFTHWTNIYWVPTIMKELEIQQWINCTKIETKGPALSGAHSLVGTGGWDRNNKENKWVKCSIGYVPCSNAMFYLDIDHDEKINQRREAGNKGKVLYR